MLGLRFCARAFSSCGKRGPLFIAVRGPLFIAVRGPFTVAASLVAGHRLQTHRLSSVAHGPSCSVACGIFPDQGSNLCPLHWQADSQPLCHQGSPIDFFFKFIFIYLWLCWVFVSVRELSLVVASGATLHRGAWAPHYRGLSRCGAQAPDAQAQ